MCCPHARKLSPAQITKSNFSSAKPDALRMSLRDRWAIVPRIHQKSTNVRSTLSPYGQSRGRISRRLRLRTSRIIHFKEIICITLIFTYLHIFIQLIEFLNK